MATALRLRRALTSTVRLPKRLPKLTTSEMAERD